MVEQEPKSTNIVYFECSSMRELYDRLENWQATNHQRFISLSIHQDNGTFCCIALIYPKNWALQQIENTEYRQEIAKFQRRALKSIGVDFNFSSTIIPLKKVIEIQTKLKNCRTAMEVREVFTKELLKQGI